MKPVKYFHEMKKGYVKYSFNKRLKFFLKIYVTNVNNLKYYRKNNVSIPEKVCYFNVKLKVSALDRPRGKLTLFIRALRPLWDFVFVS